MSLEEDTVQVVFKQGSNTYHYLDRDNAPICKHHHAPGDRDDVPSIPTEEKAVAGFMSPCEQCQMLQKHGGKTRSELMAAAKGLLETGTDSETFSKDELEEIIARLNDHDEEARTKSSAVSGENESDTALGADGLNE